MAPEWRPWHLLLACLLQLHLADVEGRDIPMKYVRRIEYKNGEALNLVLQLNNLPRVPSGQVRTILYKKQAEGRPVPVSTYDTDSSSARHSYRTSLGPEDDGTVVCVLVATAGAGHATYERTIITLVHREDRTESKDSCLVGCSIAIDEWIPNRTPTMLLLPEGPLEVSAGETVGVTCRGRDMPENIKIVIYKNQKEIGSVVTSGPDTVTRKRIDMKAGDDPTTVQCVSHYTSTRSERVESNTLTLLLKEDKNHTAARAAPVASPWVVAPAAAAAALCAALALGVCLRRKRKVSNDGYGVEVENELYGPEYGTEYAQPYDHRRPPPSPRTPRAPRAPRAAYANVPGR